MPAPPAFTPFEPAFAPPGLPRGAAEWEEAIRDGLHRAVRRQLMSDVPVGTLLSGGVDSTVVTALMRDGLPGPPQAFAIGFADDDDGGELAVARQAAVALGVPLHEVSVHEREYREAWLAAEARSGEPIANSGAMMLGLLCRAAGRTHKVVLSGQGADEPLGGYPRHAGERWYPLARRLRPLLGLLPERMAASDRVARMRRLAGTPVEAARFAGLLAVFPPAEAARLVREEVDPDQLVDPVRRWLPMAPEGDSLNRLLFVDARLSLADDLLTVADHVAMASSVELRVPFLDLELMALLERMPGRYKVSALGERKWLYRRAVRPLLPPVVRDALTGWRGRVGRKLGFTTPLDAWFGAGAAEDPAALLLGPDARLPAFLNPDALEREVAMARRRPRTRQIMALAVLESWLRGVA
jgi:asparagine synthase (glutamine-hydrolysing)